MLEKGATTGGSNNQCLKKLTSCCLKVHCIVLPWGDLNEMFVVELIHKFRCKHRWRPLKCDNAFILSNGSLCFMYYLLFATVHLLYSSNSTTHGRLSIKFWIWNYWFFRTIYGPDFNCIWDLMKNIEIVANGVCRMINLGKWASSQIANFMKLLWLKYQ